MRSAQRKALIIGISDYTNLQKLDFCRNDGTEIYEVLGTLGYEVSDKNKLVGEVKGEKVKDAIYDFFDDMRNIPDDTLLFYYSGHGVPDVDGDMYLASSDTDPDKPYRRGFSFEELTKMIQKSISTSVVVILDCCYSGSARVSKGHEEDAAKIGSTSIDEKSKKLPQGQGKYILSASQAAQEAYALETGEHSIFTYYLLQGLRGNTESVDSEGNVTPQSLGKYVYKAIMSLPADKRPKQKPITRGEESGDVILASHPELKPSRTLDTKKVGTPANDNSSGRHNHKQPLMVTLSTLFSVKKGEKKYRLTLPILGAVAIGVFVIVLINSTVQHSTNSLPIKTNSIQQPRPTPVVSHSNSNISGSPYSFVQVWRGPLVGNGQFNNPSGVAIDSGGNVYVADYWNNGVQKFDSTGHFITKWGISGSAYGQFNNPSGVAIDSGGNVYVADSGNNRIQKFDGTGHFITKWGRNGTDSGQFNNPSAVAIDSGGNVYVAEYGNDRIQKFDSAGHFITKWGSNATAGGQLSGPSGVAIDSAGNVYVADTGNNRIQKFDSTGHFITKWGSNGTAVGQLNSPDGVAVDHTGNVYVADAGNNRIQKFDSTGHFITKWGSNGTAVGQLSGPSAVAIDSGGNVYVADAGNNRIQKFDGTGNFITQWGIVGSAYGQFNNPSAVALDSGGNVYVSDYGNARIQKFDGTGNFITQWGIFRSDSQLFNSPEGVAVDHSGNVYVADSLNNRIQVFSPTR